jgi:hypothetical protein
MNALASLPSFVAVPLGEFVAETSHPVLRLHRLHKVVAILTRFCTSLALGELRANSGDGRLPHALLKQIRPLIERPTVGIWPILLGASLDALPGDHLRVVPQLPDFVRRHLLPQLRRAEATPQQSLVSLASELMTRGVMPSDQAQALLAHWEPWLELLVGRLAFLDEVQVCYYAQDVAHRLVGPNSKFGGECPLSGNLRLALSQRHLGGHVLVLRQEKWLDLWPLCAYGRARERTESGIRMACEESPLVYFRAEATRLLYEPLGCALSQAEDGAGIQDFRDLFDLAAHRPADPGEVRDFEEEIRADAAALVGRHAELKHLKATLKNASTGVFWVGGPAGIGKSALLAKVACELRGDPRKVCRLAWRFRADDGARCNRVAFFRYAVQRLSAWPVLDSQTLTLAAEPDALYEQLCHLLDETARLTADDPRGRPPRVLFILDGLDAIEYLDPGFARVPFESPRANVVWVCAGRAERTLPQVFAAGRCTHVFPDGVSAMPVDDIGAMFLNETNRLGYDLLNADREVTGQVRNAVLQAVVERADGLPLYVRLVVEDSLADHFHFNDLETRLPPGLNVYFEELLRRQIIGELHALLTPLLVTLVWAPEPLDAESLLLLLARRQVLLANDQGRTLLQQGLETLQGLLRVVPTPYGGVRYDLFHSSIRDHIRADLAGKFAMQNALARQAFADPLLTS